MEFPRCSICWMPYNITPDGIGGWVHRKACACVEPPPVEITYTGGTVAIPNNHAYINGIRVR